MIRAFAALRSFAWCRAWSPDITGMLDQYNACTWITHVILSNFGPLEFRLLGTTWDSLTNMAEATFRVRCSASSAGISLATSDGSWDTTDEEGVKGGSFGWGVVGTMASFLVGTTFGMSISLRTGVGTGGFGIPLPTLASFTWANNDAFQHDSTYIVWMVRSYDGKCVCVCKGNSGTSRGFARRSSSSLAWVKLQKCTVLVWTLLELVGTI